MLTDLLILLPVALFVWLAEKLGVHAGLHEWVEGLCPCDAA